MKLSDQGKHASATELESHLKGGHLPDKGGDAYGNDRRDQMSLWLRRNRVKLTLA